MSENKKSALWEFLQEVALENENWEVNLPSFFKMQNIYEGLPYFKKTVKAFQSEGKVELNGESIRIIPGSLRL